jgi:threonine/homoserine/homoserine lactone efflux protein
MGIYLLAKGTLIGFLVAVPVGPLGLLCINRALSLGPLSGLFSGFGVATADALAAGVAALGISLISSFLIDHQEPLRFLGGLFLCYLGYRIYATKPGQPSSPNNVNGFLGAYITTLLLTLSNPITVLSFVAIYAGFGVESLSGHYFAAALLTLGVFTGSALWWVALFVGVTLFREHFSLAILGWIHRLSGGIIIAFGIGALLSLSPLKSIMDIGF